MQQSKSSLVVLPSSLLLRLFLGHVKDPSITNPHAASTSATVAVLPQLCVQTHAAYHRSKMSLSISEFKVLSLLMNPITYLWNSNIRLPLAIWLLNGIFLCFLWKLQVASVYPADVLTSVSHHGTGGRSRRWCYSFSNPLQTYVCKPPIRRAILAFYFATLLCRRTLRLQGWTFRWQTESYEGTFSSSGISVRAWRNTLYILQLIYI